MNSSAIRLTPTHDEPGQENGEQPGYESQNGSLLSFADSARELERLARLQGLNVPSFRSPPRRDRLTRSIRWRQDGSATVAVRLAGRPISSIQRDLVEGLLEANRLEGAHRDAMRSLLLNALESGLAAHVQSRHNATHGNSAAPHDPAA